MPVSGCVDDVQDEDELFAGAVRQLVCQDVGQARDGLFVGAEDAAGAAGGKGGEGFGDFLYFLHRLFGGFGVIPGDVEQNFNRSSRAGFA